MSPYSQLHLVEDDGIPGDCFRTAIGCVLDIAPADVPHFVHVHPDGMDWADAADAWVTAHGYDLRWLFDADARASAVAYLRERPELPQLLLAVGDSPRGVFPHVVVESLDGELLHDPYPWGSGYVGPARWWLAFVDLDVLGVPS